MSQSEFKPVRTVTNGMHIHCYPHALAVMILVDGIYEEYVYRDWPALFLAHPIMLTAKGVTLFVRG